MSVNQDRSTLMIYGKLCGLFVLLRRGVRNWGFSEFINLPKYPEDKICPKLRGLAQIFPQSSFLLDVNPSPR